MPHKVLTDEVAQLRDELDLVRGEVAGLQQLLRFVVKSESFDSWCIKGWTNPRSAAPVRLRSCWRFSIQRHLISQLKGQSRRQPQRFAHILPRWSQSEKRPQRPLVASCGGLWKGSAEESPVVIAFPNHPDTGWSFVGLTIKFSPQFECSASGHQQSRW